MEDMRARVAVLIDYENVRQMAQVAFGRGRESAAWFGHVEPLRLAMRLAGERTLVATYVFRGEPDRGPSPGAWEDFNRRRQAWGNAGIRVISAPVRHGAEKGMDVALGTELGIGAAQNAYDVAVIASGDNDYLTAISRVRDLGRQVEVAGWRASGSYVPGTMMDVPVDIRRHRLDVAAFVGVASDEARSARYIADLDQPSAMRLAWMKAGQIQSTKASTAAA